ncbi:signal transduction histidine kinase [Hamadaea flava]|uniref:histidine kinase n=1 Tax=Hamadaea flava TaxID=1742688 RepID=A0ABV8LYD6_9ACTN|nr:histidine kinase [Hamadaea flava]MCP2329053.1 signal transduction histidine kinase [Hamadaea flava]
MAGLVAALLDRLRRMQPVLGDSTLAVACIAVTLVIAPQVRLPGSVPFDLVGVLLTLGCYLPLALRRKAPVAVLVVTCVSLEVYLLAGYVPTLNLFGPLLALYSVAAQRPAFVTGVSATAAAVPIFTSAIAADLSLELALGQAIVAPGVAWMFGNNTRNLAVLTRRLRAEQAQRARQAIGEERLRIARELHDVVAHHMSVISVQAGLADYVLSTDPSTARGAVKTIAETSHQALDEMRHMLALLRLGADGETPEPLPGLRRLDDLVQQTAAAGVEVDVIVTGAERELSGAVDGCVFRVIQESLTNVIKHASPAQAQVRLEYRPDALVVRILDNGRRRTPSAAAGAAPGGHGILGMRERAQVYGGTLTAGRRPEGGFEVVLTLPTRPGASD